MCRSSIVPFTNEVNVGTGNVGASWIDWTDWERRARANTSLTNHGFGPPGTERLLSLDTAMTAARVAGAEQLHATPFPPAAAPRARSAHGHMTYLQRQMDRHATATITTAATPALPTRHQDHSSQPAARRELQRLFRQPIAAAPAAAAARPARPTPGSTSMSGRQTDHSTWERLRHGPHPGLRHPEARTPSAATTGFPADNNDNCPGAAIMTTLSYDWTT